MVVDDGGIGIGSDVDFGICIFDVVVLNYFG